ncbi:MAG: flavodoxin family protein [Spirochaetales bacterium]|nr:flavodoxin family protein [Spirochaetales bacterium]
MENILIVYFSGTGCTRLVAETFGQQLVKKGIPNRIHELRHDSADPDADTAAPQFLSRYWRKMQRVGSGPA